MKSWRQLPTIACLICSVFASIHEAQTQDLPANWPASYPSWWYNAADPANGLIDGTKTEFNQNNSGILNQGQLWNIAYNGINELNNKLSLIGGAGFTLADFSNGNTPSYYSPANLGQLKNVSSKFFDRFAELGFTPNSAGWPATLILDTGAVDNSPNYPWLNDQTPDNFKPANIGQAKHLFSWDLTQFSLLLTKDTDGDGLSDYQENYTYNTDPNNPDTDNDGINDGVEIATGTDPNIADATDTDNGDDETPDDTEPNNESNNEVYYEVYLGTEYNSIYNFTNDSELKTSNNTIILDSRISQLTISTDHNDFGEFIDGVYSDSYQINTKIAKNESRLMLVEANFWGDDYLLDISSRPDLIPSSMTLNIEEIDVQEHFSFASDFIDTELNNDGPTLSNHKIVNTQIIQNVTNSDLEFNINITLNGSYSSTELINDLSPYTDSEFFFKTHGYNIYLYPIQVEEFVEPGESAGCTGYDDGVDSGGEPALMVPLEGSNKIKVILKGIPQDILSTAQFISKNSKVTISLETPISEETVLTISGNGTTGRNIDEIQLEIEGAATPIKLFEVDVLKRRNVDINIHTVTAQNNLDRVPTNVPSASSLANYLNTKIWGNQANVYFNVTNKGSSIIDYDLDNNGFLPYYSYGVEHEVFTDGLGDENVNIYYIYKLSGLISGVAHTDTAEAWIATQTSDNEQHTTAHELGHILGLYTDGTHSPYEKDIMHADSENSCRIRREHWNTANP